MELNIDKDPLVLIVDDFAGSGQTLGDGLTAFFSQTSRKVLEKYLKEERILCYFLYSFPEAMERLQKKFSRVNFLAINTFGDEVKALDPNAGIFENEKEINFARDMLTQIGRQLYQQYPLGRADMGALVCFANTIPNNTLPIFWSGGKANDKPWRPLFPRA
jgi:hypothetical protein